MKKIMIVIMVVIMVLVLFIVRLPTVQALSDPRKGLAMAYPVFTEDLAKFGSQNIWWYDWGSNGTNDPRYVPMSWCGEDPNLPTSTGRYVMLFNEPYETGQQCIQTPAQGIAKYMVLKAKYPYVKWVVGNDQIIWGQERWMIDFHDLCHTTPGCIMPIYWGIHIYWNSSFGGCNMQCWINQTEASFNHLTSHIGYTSYWVTEFADTFALNAKSISEVTDHPESLLYWIESHSWQIKRYAYFTNRSTNNNDPYWYGWAVHLFDWYTGQNTVLGNWYVPRPAP